MACAACGARKVERKTTFMVDRPGCSGEFAICAACWSEGENNENWNESITLRIVARGSKPVAAIGGSRVSESAPREG